MKVARMAGTIQPVVRPIASITTATSVMKIACQPPSRLAAPSSSSMNSCALESASSLTTPTGSVMRSVDLDAVLGEILRGAGMEGDRRGGGLLVLQLEVLGFLM